MRSTLLLIVSVLLLYGCASEGTQSQNAEGDAPATTAQGSGHAPADVVPGSHEDWCAEHGVPETQCTRCNASLIPAFQAAGDWDSDHGLPMSQCKIHDPNLVITRPPPEGH